MNNNDRTLYTCSFEKGCSKSYILSVLIIEKVTLKVVFQFYKNIHLYYNHQ